MAKKNLSTKTTMENLAVVIKDTLAYKEDIPVNVSELTNDANYQNATQPWRFMERGKSIDSKV